MSTTVAALSPLFLRLLVPNHDSHPHIGLGLGLRLWFRYEESQKYGAPLDFGNLYLKQLIDVDHDDNNDDELDFDEGCAGKQRNHSTLTLDSSEEFHHLVMEDAWGKGGVKPWEVL